MRDVNWKLSAFGFVCGYMLPDVFRYSIALGVIYTIAILGIAVATGYIRAKS